MGYNSWYDLECTGAMNETTLRMTADAMVAKGLVGVGFEYLNLDDCWAAGRDAQGVVYPEASRFPSGMKALADYAHNKSLKFGVYTDRGNNTCAGRPGSLDHEEIDALTYASWGVDYLKEDSCYASTDHQTAFDEYGKMRDSLAASGRPIYFSLCGWESWYAPVGASLGNSWRIGQDDVNWKGILVNINVMATVAQYSAPGGWNDPCLLLSIDATGAEVVTPLQSRAQFSMWAVMTAPLLISGSVLKMTPYTLQTYTNKDVIAVNQDPLGHGGIRVAGDDLPTSPTNVWGKTLTNNRVAMVFLNVGSVEATVTCPQSCLAQLNITSLSQKTVKDLWSGNTTNPTNDSLSFTLQPDGGHVMVLVY
eukprot:TRINITY_DN2660_c0_g1_i1.p1 TRINITY_DN2660_c0_g1~~TRINITY_DN2660_c0_g1_i1.p1  ORF type:complete len:406 (+),score=110.72 TRINITY_DN2660_c0_g1_i1:128-1219(+)